MRSSTSTTPFSFQRFQKFCTTAISPSESTRPTIPRQAKAQSPSSKIQQLISPQASAQVATSSSTPISGEPGTSTMPTSTPTATQTPGRKCSSLNSPPKEKSPAISPCRFSAMERPIRKTASAPTSASNPTVAPSQQPATTLLRPSSTTATVTSATARTQFRSCPPVSPKQILSNTPSK